jgi:hypothetical protein
MDNPSPSRPVEAADNYVYNQGTDSSQSPVAWSQQDNQSYRDASNYSQESDANLNNVTIDDAPPPGGWQPVEELPPPAPVADYVPTPICNDYDYNNCYGNNYGYDYPAIIAGSFIGGIVGGEIFGGRREWGAPYVHEFRSIPMHGGGGFRRH